MEPTLENKIETLFKLLYSVALLAGISAKELVAKTIKSEELLAYMNEIIKEQRKIIEERSKIKK